MSPEALIGMELGKSVLQRLLGQGTMGAVYLAAQEGRQVAVKVFLQASPLAEAENEAFQRRLEETVARGASLDHPHILPVLNYGREKQLVYQVMPYIAGQSMETLFVRGETLPFVQIQHYLEQLATALDYAHARDILHGDIKASNILLTTTGDLLLGDFGLASVTLEKNFASTRRAVPGMLNTIAPEYVLSQPIDQRTDLYALGVVLSQMAMGTPPFVGKSLGEVAMKHVKSAPPAPGSLRADLPTAAEQVILRALAKQPADRYVHARDLASAFRLALEAARPAPAEKQATHALNILSETFGSLQASGTQAAAPRTGGLFDPKWRTQASLATFATAQQASQGEATEVAPSDRGEEATLAQFLSADKRPTGAVPQMAFDLSAEGAQEEFTTPTFLPADAKLPPTEFSPSARRAGSFKRTGLLSPERQTRTLDQQNTLEQSQTLPNGMSGSLQVTHQPASTTDELRKFATEQSPGLTGTLGLSGQRPNDDSRSNTIKFTEAAKFVPVPIAGQPGRFMTGYLPKLPPEEPAPALSKRFSTRMKIVSLALALLIVATGSGIFLATRQSSNNQASNASRAQRALSMQARATAMASATANANIILSDTLSQNINQWPTGSQGWYTCSFENNAYHIVNHDKTKSAPVLLPGKTMNGPFTYTLTMDQIKGDTTTSNDLFGMILYATVQNVPGKSQVDKFYAFEILNNTGGQYQFWKYDNSKSAASPWKQLWSKKFGKEFKQGNGLSHVNTVKIIATGTMFTFIVNGKQVGTWKDHSFTSGSVGMLVNMDGSEVAFSNLLLTYS